MTRAGATNPYFSHSCCGFAFKRHPLRREPSAGWPGYPNEIKRLVLLMFSGCYYTSERTVCQHKHWAAVRGESRKTV